jgi:hypothetical protein
LRPFFFLQIDSQETEWYYPLLKPNVHYIPMVANGSWVNLEEVIGWAEQHQEEVAKIVDSATAFATRYPGDCLTCSLTVIAMLSIFDWSIRY